ncbi:MAG: esterase family protein [Burkholderiales bacterium]|nr:esterase family protein [Anaerolineae bacterium]
MQDFTALELTADSLLERARKEGAPLIDGERVTFVWHGEHAPELMGDFSGWGWGGEPVTMTEVESGTGVWTYSLTLPLDAYIQYAYVVDGQRVRDPFNLRVKVDSQDEPNSFFEMPDVQHTSLIKRRRKGAHGVMTRHTVENLFHIVGSNRRVHLYHPPTTEPVPLLLVLDGQDYIGQGRLLHMVDNLIGQGRIRPIAMALAHHGRQARVVEYGCSESTLAFFVDSVLPLAHENLNLLDIDENPGAYGIMGASMGGLMSLYSGLRVPHIFGKVLTQSGAFHIGHHETVVYELIHSTDVKPLNIWMDVGQYEYLLGTNDSMYKLLQNKGYNVDFNVFAGGHNYMSWRDDVWRGLEALFGPERDIITVPSPTKRGEGT